MQQLEYNDELLESDVRLAAIGGIQLSLVPK